MCRWFVTCLVIFHRFSYISLCHPTPFFQRCKTVASDATILPVKKSRKELNLASLFYANNSWWLTFSTRSSFIPPWITLWSNMYCYFATFYENCFRQQSKSSVNILYAVHNLRSHRTHFIFEHYWNALHTQVHIVLVEENIIRAITTLADSLEEKANKETNSV